MNESGRQRIRNAVESRMRSFEAAERSLDADRLIAHFARVSEFRVYNDGHRLDYAGMTANVQAGFPTLRSIDGGFENIEVFVLSPDAALAAAEFTEAITDQTGIVTRVRGTATWLWRLTDGEWKIVYGHADHYPDETREQPSEPSPGTPA